MTILTDPTLLSLSLLVALIAGVVKGVVGFAMPMILISGLSGFMPPELALAGLVMPTLATNGMQALRQGAAAAWESVRRFRVFLLSGLVMLLLSAQLVRILPPNVLLLLIGVPVVAFVLSWLSGYAPRLPTPPGRRVEMSVGAFAGFIGGLSGVWGPPTVMFLTALDTEKREQMRVQGVIYGLGAIALFGAHIGSGLIRADTLPFSLALVPPAILGMWIGGRVQDRIDQQAFRRATLIVLLVAGLNLIRRALLA